MKFLSVSLLLLISSAVSFADSSATVSVKLSPAGSFKADTKDVKGSAVQRGAEVTAENIMVDLKSLNSGIALRDEHMKNKYLDLKNHPHAILVFARGNSGRGEGKIKINGIEKPVSGIYKIKGKELDAEFELKLSDFGISGIKYMGVGVSDNVKVNVTVPLVAGAAAAPVAKPTASVQQKAKTAAAVKKPAPAKKK